MAEEREKISMSNTKREMLDAYQSLLKEVEAKSKENPKEEQKRVEAKKVVDRTEALSPEELESFTREMLDTFEQSVGSLRQQLRDGYEKLRDLDETIRLKEEWIEELYAIRCNADSLSTLILAEKKQKEEARQELEETKAALEREISDTREAWSREKEQHASALKQEKADLAIERKREAEEYNYTTAQKRREEEEDEFRARRQAEERALEEAKATFERDCEERTKQLTEAEGELERLRTLAAGLDARIDEATAEAVRTTTERLESEHRYRFDLARKEAEGELKLREQQVELLETKVRGLEAQLKEAGLKVATSEETVKDIALRAIDSSTLVGRSLTRDARPTPPRDPSDEA